MFRLTQLRMLGRHMGDRTMMLTDLHSLTSAVHRGGIPVLVQDLSQLTGHILYRFTLFYQGTHICNESLEADLGKALNSLRPADRA